MSGTNKAILSISVLLLAALVVYYGMTPPESTDLPVQKQLVFGGDSGELLEEFVSQETTVSAPEIAEEESNGSSIPYDPETAGQLTDATDSITVEALVAIVGPTYKEYTVLKDDTYWSIAKKHLMTKGNAIPSQKDIGNLVERIKRENPDKDPKNLKPGDKITILKV